MNVASTIPEMFQSTVEKYPDQTALARRESGRWVPTTYRELADKSALFSKSLYSLGVRFGDRVALMLGNSPEWAIADIGALSLGAADVPLYATLADDQAKHILKDSGAKAVMVAGDEQLGKLRRIAGDLPDLQLVITVEEGAAAVGSKRTISLASAMKMGSEMSAEDEKEMAEKAKKPGANDLASIIYTSGTTGLSKGVMLSHGNFTSNVSAIYGNLEILPTDRHLSFLPLSHAFERTCGYYCLIGAGAAIYYAESIEKIGENIKEVKPSIVISVPRLFEKMIGKIKDKVAAAPAIRQKLFHWAMDVGARVTDPENPDRHSITLLLQYAIAKKLVFSKLQQAFGGNIRFFVSGGAALSLEIALFFRTIGIKVAEGYGLTETTPVISFNPLENIKPGTVGTILSNLETRFLEDGELLVKGPSVATGYFNNYEATKGAFDSDGWFHTGDIAELDSQGYLKITDRKKDLIVLSNGKNIAPLTIESVLVGDDYISQIMVMGNNRNFVSAIIIPDFERLKRYGADQGIDAADNNELIKNESVQTFYRHRVDDLMKGFARYEQVRRFVLLPAEFTEATGELTPTLKIKRKVVEKKFAEEIEGLYTKAD